MNRTGDGRSFAGPSGSRESAKRETEEDLELNLRKMVDSYDQFVFPAHQTLVSNDRYLHPIDKHLHPDVKYVHAGEQKSDTGQKRFFCHFCLQPFVHKDILTHMNSCKYNGSDFEATFEAKIPFNEATKAPSAPNQIGSEKPKSTTNKTTTTTKFTCEFCNKDFSRKSRLTEHKRSHTGEKPFSCDICLKRFFKNSHLNDHKLTHTKTKLFSCDICLKTFSKNSHLTDHKRSHTGLRPFSCDVCDKDFTRKSHLNDHKRSHCKKDPLSCVVVFKKKSKNKKRDLARAKNVQAPENVLGADTSGNNVTQPVLYNTQDMSIKKDNYLYHQYNQTGYNLITESQAGYNSIMERHTGYNLAVETRTGCNPIMESQSRYKTTMENRTACNSIMESQTRYNSTTESQTGYKSTIVSQARDNSVESQPKDNSIMESQTRSNTIIKNQTGFNLMIESQTGYNTIVEKSTKINNNQNLFDGQCLNFFLKPESGQTKDDSVKKEDLSDHEGRRAEENALKEKSTKQTIGEHLFHDNITHGYYTEPECRQINEIKKENLSDHEDCHIGYNSLMKKPTEKTIGENSIDGNITHGSFTMPECVQTEEIKEENICGQKNVQTVYNSVMEKSTESTIGENLFDDGNRGDSTAPKYSISEEIKEENLSDHENHQIVFNSIINKTTEQIMRRNSLDGDITQCNFAKPEHSPLEEENHSHHEDPTGDDYIVEKYTKINLQTEQNSIVVNPNKRKFKLFIGGSQSASKIPEYSCQICNKSFSKNYLLTRHIIRHKNKANKPYVCDACGMRFVNENKLKKHQLSHPELGLALFQCDYCNKQFTRKSVLADHIRKHLGEGDFSCEICGKTFYRQHYLNDHIRSHTGEKPFSCDLCPRTFSQRSCLALHKRRHNNDAPYSCNVCDKAFYLRSVMTRHKMGHDDERPVACDFCDKRFFQKCDLTQHLRTHTGEKPFVCDVCDRGFSQKNHLITHGRVHSRKSSSANNVKN